MARTGEDARQNAGQFLMAEDLPQKSSTSSGKNPRTSKMTRKDRLAEELRGNLKRRKTATRRQKDGGQEKEDGGTDDGP
jgi:hypothetical protein